MHLTKKSKTAPIIFIAIDGKGGAGKSTLAAQLAVELGAGIIHSDDFTTFDKPAFDGSDLLVSHVFDPIMKGNTTLSYERLQVWPGEPTHVMDQPVQDIMIIEGCGASCAKFRPYLSYTILAELDDATRIARIIERDVVEGGRSEEDNDEIGALWAAKEDEYFAGDDPHGRADIIVDSLKPFDAAAVAVKLASL